MVNAQDERDRARRWESTMSGHGSAGLRTAHANSSATLVQIEPSAPLVPSAPSPPTGSSWGREAREYEEDLLLAPGATRARCAGRRKNPEEPDPYRTCFERDRDRILHCSAFRRLAGKTQVFIFPSDHQRTRLTHALEVAQVASSVARACRLNVALTEAIALGHDCGHGPGGHASEGALGSFLAGGFDHAVWGADVSLADLNLCEETLDGIRNHSWSRPAPSTPEGEVVSWADRIAYVCHDWEDAVSAGIVSTPSLPEVVSQRCGEGRSAQLRSFISEMIETVSHTGRVAMREEMAEALAAFRRCNYDRIYMRPASVAQGSAVIEVLRVLVEHFTDHPYAVPDVRRAGGLDAGSDGARRAAVAYVAGMTDRFAMERAMCDLGWESHRLPRGIQGVPR